MLTSIKEALNNERYYDAVSNKINSTVLEYSPISELEKESKTMIEDSYKDLRPNIDVVTKVAIESTNMMENLSKNIYPSYNKINSMRGSFSTEGAFQDFLSMALNKFISFIDKIVETVLKIWHVIKQVCQNIKKFLILLFKINCPVFKNATELKRWINKNNLSAIQISDMLSIDSPDTGRITLKCFDIDSKNADGSSKFDAIMEVYTKQVCEIKPSGYVSRIRERSKILQNICYTINDFSEESINALSDEDNDDTIQTIVSKLSSDMKRDVNQFFKSIDDVNDLNGWVIREYKIKAPHTNHGVCAWEDVFTDKLVAHQLVDNLKYNKSSVLSKVNNLKDNDSIYSLYSPLTANDIRNKVGCPTIIEKTFNVKDLFGNATCAELLDKILDTAKVAELSSQTLKKDVSILTNTVDIINECSEKSITAVNDYRKELNSITAADDKLAIRRVFISMIMKLFQDINFASMTMNNIIFEDIFNRSKITTDVLRSMNDLLKNIKTSANKCLEKSR